MGKIATQCIEEGSGKERPLLDRGQKCQKDSWNIIRALTTEKRIKSVQSSKWQSQKCNTLQKKRIKPRHPLEDWMVKEKKKRDKFMILQDKEN